MAREKKPAPPRRAEGGVAKGARAAGSGRPARGGEVGERDDVTREAVRHARPARASAASGRVAGAIRSDASVRGRRQGDEPLEAGRTSSARAGAPPPVGAVERASDEPEHTPSPTAVAAEALRTGVLSGAVSSRADQEEIPGESEKIRAGDPENETLRNEYVGEETPGGSTPTPDQGNVDDIGRAYGVSEEDSGELRTSTEILEGRDQRRRGGGGGKQS